ncbi:hypothetical protein [Halobaculum sp. EA56]|uniref:hypothetical protein n=1 Tax=Halobaculum sp. EA56 TaxID=3421648 RepID=UPI003EBA478D
MVDLVEYRLHTLVRPLTDLGTGDPGATLQMSEVEAFAVVRDHRLHRSDVIHECLDQIEFGTRPPAVPPLHDRLTCSVHVFVGDRGSREFEVTRVGEVRVLVVRN